MNGTTAYALALKKVKGLASGFDHAEKTGDNTFDVYFVDGSHVSLTIPQPEIDYDKLEADMDAFIIEWLEEHKDELKGEDGKDGKGVQILNEDETESDIKDDTVLAFKWTESESTDESYNKAQSDARYAKSIDVGNVSRLTLSTWSDLVDAINDVYGKGMGSYRFEVDASKKLLTLVCRNGVEVPIDISQIILNTNITEFKDMLVTSILDGQSLVWNASKKKWVNKSIDSSGVLVEAKKYTDDEIAKFNNKGSIAVDEKPTYYGGIITYKRGGVTETTDNAGTWFYYFDDNDKAVQTIFIEGTEFTIAMAGDINLDDYIAQTEKIDVFDDSFTDKTKVPTTRYIEELKGIIDDALGDKVNVEDIEDSLTSDANDKPLSAKQGKELKTQIDGLIDDDADNTVEDKTYSAKKIAEAIDGVNPSWNGTKAEFEALDKSTLKDGQTVNITDDYESSDLATVEYVDEKVLKNYTTDEKVVGTFLGKPLYEKTVSIATISTDFQNPSVIATNVAELVNAHGSVNFTSWGNTTRTAIPLSLATSAAGGYIAPVVYNGTLGLFYSVAGASWTFKDAIITVQYTKTTD